MALLLLDAYIWTIFSRNYPTLRLISDITGNVKLALQIAVFAVFGRVLQKISRHSVLNNHGSTFGHYYDYFQSLSPFDSLF